VSVASYEEVLAQAAERDPRVVVLTAENRAAIRGLPARLGVRFIDVGIAEQTLVGVAAGLALRGRVPVVHALATFLTMRAFEFIRTDVGIPRLPVKIVGGVPGVLSEANGPTHQAIEDVALMRGIPGMEIFCPADAEELASGMPQVLASPNPVYVRFNAATPAAPHPDPVTWGRAEVMGSGTRVAIFTYGYLVREAVAALPLLQARGLPGTVINLRTLAPIDRLAVLRASVEAEMVVTLEDHFVTGGLFSIVSELWARAGIARPILPIGFEERWFHPAMLPSVLRCEGFTAPQLTDRIGVAYRSVVPRR
jgi:transketolase